MSSTDRPEAPELDRRFLVEQGLAGTVALLVEPALGDLGYRLVRVRIGGAPDGGDGVHVQIMCERPDGSMSVNDCETVSRQLSPLLDASDPIESAYRLEISSPGIDRPLVRPSDFIDWAGYEAKIELGEPVNGRRRFRGVLDGFEDGEVRIACDLGELGTQVLGFATALVAEARLVLNDDLIRETLRRSKKSTAAVKRKSGKRGSRRPSHGADRPEPGDTPTHDTPTDDTPTHGED